MKPYTPEWQVAANMLARSWAPNIYPCKKCNYPVIDGHCCENCGDPNPKEALNENTENQS
jgi:predicted RNA-binding protein with PUA domain